MLSLTGCGENKKKREVRGEAQGGGEVRGERLGGVGGEN